MLQIVLYLNSTVQLCESQLSCLSLMYRVGESKTYLKILMN